MTKTSADRKNADKVFEKWSSELRNKSRSKEYLYENFYDLFYNLSNNLVPADMAHEFLSVAVSKHLPDKHVLKNTYAKSTANKSHSLAEFHEGWKELIKDKAVQAFYDVYPINAPEPTPLVTSLEDKGKIHLPKGMSKEEYSRQRRHVQQYPILDMKLLDEMYKDTEANNLDVDLDKVLEDLDDKN